MSYILPLVPSPQEIRRTRGDAAEARVFSQAEGIVAVGRLASALAMLRCWAAALVIVAGVVIAPPALAHKGERHGKAQAVQKVLPNGQTGPVPAATASATQEPSHRTMGQMDLATDRSNMSVFQRLYEWMGRLHPLIVHFPIAFFPAALFTAIVGRRRPAFSAPVQFLVVAGGIFAPIAALAGWLAGVGSDPDPILAYHRWLGVAVGVGGAALAAWAWRRLWEDRGAGMILSLALMTVAIAVQSFLGAGITHGIEHLMF